MSKGSPDATPTRAELWDARHAAHDPIESADADPTLIEVAVTLAPGAALDLGAGDGRNAAGRFTLEDVESVGTSDDEPAARALDLREFAGLKLREAGEEDVLEERCTEYYVSSCRRSAEGARYALVEWLAWMDLEIDTIRSVLRRCLVHGDASRGMDLAASLRWFWYTRATTDGVRWLDAFRAIGPGDPEPQARAEYMRGMLAVLLVDPTAARPALERAAAGNHAAGRLGPLAESLSMGSIAANMAGDRASARRLVDEAQAVAAGIDDVGDALPVLQARAFGGLFEGDLEAVRSASSEGERRVRGGDLAERVTSLSFGRWLTLKG